MGDKTTIEWTDSTWPIVNGCRRISPGCENCYAERLEATRLRSLPKYSGLATMTPSGPRWTGETRLWAPDLTLPLRWKRPRRIFVADMGDLFYEGVSDEEIRAVFGVMAACPQHTFQVLTKRAERMRVWVLAEHAERCLDAALQVLRQPGASSIEATGALVGARSRSRLHWPLPNVHLGVSVENQEQFDRRIHHLRATPAPVQFLSCEPLLGPINLEPRGVDWVIVGGESGPHARPCAVEWIRRVIEQCKVAYVPCFVKQMGAHIRGPHAGFAVERYELPEGEWWVPPVIEAQSQRAHFAEIRAKAIGFRLFDRKGGNPKHWPEDLRIREFPMQHTNQSA